MRGQDHVLLIAAFLIAMAVVTVSEASQGAISSYDFVNVHANHALLVRFGVGTCPTNPVKVLEPGITYATLDAAYSAASEGQTIQGQAIDLYPSGGLFDISKALIFDGGYNCNFGSKIDYSLIHGTMQIRDGGSSVVDGLLLMN